MEDLPEVRTLGEVLTVLRREHEIYLRISAGPQWDRLRGAWDNESGYLLPGLPAWPLRPEEWWPAESAVWVARQFVHQGFQLSGGRGYRAWLLTGEVTGHSALGEPLLARWEPVARVAHGVLAEADLLYATWRTRALR